MAQTNYVHTTWKAEMCTFVRDSIKREKTLCCVIPPHSVHGSASERSLALSFASRKLLYFYLTHTLIVGVCIIISLHSFPSAFSEIVLVFLLSPQRAELEIPLAGSRSASPSVRKCCPRQAAAQLVGPALFGARPGRFPSTSSGPQPFSRRVLSAVRCSGIMRAPSGLWSGERCSMFG